MQCRLWEHQHLPSGTFLSTTACTNVTCNILRPMSKKYEKQAVWMIGSRRLSLRLHFPHFPSPLAKYLSSVSFHTIDYLLPVYLISIICYDSIALKKEGKTINTIHYYVLSESIITPGPEQRKGCSVAVEAGVIIDEQSSVRA